MIGICRASRLFLALWVAAFRDLKALGQYYHDIDESYYNNILPLAEKLDVASSASHVCLSAYRHAHAAFMPRRLYMDSQEDFMAQYTDAYHHWQKYLRTEHYVYLCGNQGWRCSSVA